MELDGFMGKGKRGIRVAIFFIILQLTMPALANQAYLSDIVVTNTRDHLLVYFSVSDCFTAEMNRAIESGIDTTFTFYIRLFGKRDYWWDVKMADVEISHSIKYDNLKKNYEVRLPEQNNKVVTVKDFDEARRLMAEVVAVKVIALRNLKKGEHYQLRMMAQLNKIKLPLYLHYVFFFLSLWDFETDWYSIDLRY